jgi:hypothetical protein
MASDGPARRAFDDNLLTAGDNLTAGHNLAAATNF